MPKTSFTPGIGTRLTAAANTLLQTLVAEDKRGRVVSLYTMMVTGLAPVGGLVAGLLADRVGAAPALRLAGGACVLAWLTLAVRPARRPLGAPADGEAALRLVGHLAPGEAVGLQPVEQALRLPRVQGAALAPPVGVRRRVFAQLGRPFISP